MNKPTYTIKPLYLGEMTRYEKSMHTFTFDYGVKMHSPYLAFLVQGAEKNTSWYKAFLGQRITDGLEKGVYVLTFYAKAKEAGTPVSVYIKQTNEEKNDNGKLNTTFFMRRDYDADAQPNASGAQYNFKIKDAGKWTKVVVYYDMGQVVNAISSKKSNPALEVSDTDDDAAILKDCYVAILGQNKGGVVEISDVTLKKK